MHEFGRRAGARPEKPEVRLLRHLEIIVVEADRAEAEGDEQHDPDVGALRVGPQQATRAISPNRIISPPMVGVPFLVRRCEAGPSVRIGWPLPCFSRSAEMIVGPKNSTRNSAVAAAPRVRKVS